MKRALIGALPLVLAIALYGCGPSTGSDGGTDGGTLVTNLVACSDGMGGTMPCDFSCLYTQYDPPEVTGVDYEISGIVNDFFDDVPVEDSYVEVFLNGDTSGTPDGTSNTSGIDGVFTISMTGVSGNLRVAYRTVNNDPQYVDTFEYNEFLPETGSTNQERFTVPTLTVQIILGLFNLIPDPATGQIAGAFEDCNADTVTNAVVRLFETPHACGSGGTPIGGSEDDKFRIGYFDGNDYPDPKRTLLEGLNTDGLWLGANLPESYSPVAIEVWGSLQEGEPAELLGCGQLNVFAGSISILDMSPYNMSL